MIHSKRIAAVAAVLLAASPTTLLADTLVENVNGLTLDAKGEVVRFTGLVIGKDGKIARLIRSNEMAGDPKKKKKNTPRPTLSKPDFAVPELPSKGSDRV